jgi:hypothetical protein
MHRRSTMRAFALVIATALAAADVDAEAAESPPTLSRTDLFALDGDREAAGRLQVALHDELRGRSLTGAEIASITELRLAMGCKPGEIDCLARGGRAMGLDRMIVGAVAKTDAGYDVELTLVDAKAGEMLQEIHMPIATASLAADAIDATAVDLVDALFPGTNTPPVFTAAPMESVAPADVQPPIVTHSVRDPRPRWMWVGFGASAGVTAVFAAATIGTAVHLKVGLRKDLLAAVDESGADGNPDNDISPGEVDFCAAARRSPQQDGNVTNAKVTRICNKADSLLVVRNTTLGFTVVGLASTVVFSILLAVNPKPRRREMTLGPRFHYGGGASLVLGGRF